MPERLLELFRDPDFISFTQRGLPRLFQIAELESSRGGGAGMEVGSMRERVIIALLIRYFPKEDIYIGRITEAETDISILGIPISIKTITTKAKTITFAGVKAVWTVDYGSIVRFVNTYRPVCAILLVCIHIHKTDDIGSFHFIPPEVHAAVFNEFGKDAFFNIPPLNTNFRGVEFDRTALAAMAFHPSSVSFPIEWSRADLEYNIYKRWSDAWDEVAKMALTD